MEIIDLIRPDSIVSDLKAQSKKQALEGLAARAAALTGVSQRAVFDTLLERERLGTTGIGRGIAIPHGKMPEIDEIVGVFARLCAPVDFDAVDDEPVDLVFLLLAPESAGADHLKALARVSRLLRNGALCAKLREVNSADGLFTALTEGANSKAA